MGLLVNPDGTYSGSTIPLWVHGDVTEESDPVSTCNKVCCIWDSFVGCCEFVVDCCVFCWTPSSVNRTSPTSQDNGFVVYGNYQVAGQPYVTYRA